VRNGTHVIEAVEEANIVIVDDEPANLRLMERILARAGYVNVSATPDADAVLPTVAESNPDLILLDVHMPRRSGLDVLRELAPWVGPPAMVPVIMLTGDVDSSTRRTALERGARDFVSKPIAVDEVLLRIRNVLEYRRLQLQIQSDNEQLERTVRERSEDLSCANLELVERLARAAEYRDDGTHEHAQRVGRTAALIAERLGRDASYVALLRRAAPLHDVGKIGITDSIFRKPARLTAEEFAVMQQHVPIGANILADSSLAVLRLAEEVVRTHHERWDGTGYPAGLRDGEIPLPGRIAAVADVFDALTHERPYKPAWPVGEAVKEIARGSGTHFDPEIVDVFMELNHPYLLAPIGDAGDIPSAWVLTGTGKAGP
jgi:putative two-component system response regulator